MTFSIHSLTLFQEKNLSTILSTILSYAAVAALILLLIIILPCIVRILPQSTQKLATELHLAVLKNKKGEMPGASTGDPTHDKVMRRRPDKQGFRTRRTPWTDPTHDKVMRKRLDEQGISGLKGPPGPTRASTPKPESVCLTVLCLSPTLLTLTGGYP